MTNENSWNLIKPFFTNTGQFQQDMTFDVKKIMTNETELVFNNHYKNHLLKNQVMSHVIIIFKAKGSLFK